MKITKKIIIWFTIPVILFATPALPKDMIAPHLPTLERQDPIAEALKQYEQPATPPAREPEPQGHKLYKELENIKTWEKVDRIWRYWHDE